MAWLRKQGWKLGLAGLFFSQAGCLGPTETVPVGPVKPLASAAPSGDKLPTSQAIQACLAVAQNQEKNKNYDAATVQYEKVLTLDPDNLQAARRLAVLYDLRADFAKAETQYRKVAKARPHDPDLFNDWGYSCYLRHQGEEAVKHLRHALALDPNHVPAHCNLGLALGQLERYPEALQAFRGARLSDAEAHCDLAFVYLTKGKMDDARRECRAARQLDPTCTKAEEMLARLDHPEPSPIQTASAAKPERGPGRKPTRAELKAQAEAAVAQPDKTAPSSVVAVQPAPESTKPSSVVPVVYQSPNGTKWVPMKRSEPRPAPPPVPPTSGGVPGTITFGEQ